MVALAKCGALADLTIEPRPLESERNLVEKVSEQRDLVFGNRRNAIFARHADGGRHRLVRRNRMELPVGEIDPPDAAPGRFPGIERQACRGEVAGREHHVGGRACDDAGIVAAGHQHRIAAEHTGQFVDRHAGNVLLAGARQQAPRQARDRRVARRMRCRQARLIPQRRGEMAGHECDEEEDDDGHHVRRAMDQQCAIGRGEIEVVGQRRGDGCDERGPQPAVDRRGKHRREVEEHDGRIAPLRRDQQSEQRRNRHHQQRRGIFAQTERRSRQPPVRSDEDWTHTTNFARGLPGH